MADTISLVWQSVSTPPGSRVRASATLASARYCRILHHSFLKNEVAAAAGLTLVPNEKRNPLYTTTYGVGELIKDAIERGCRRFIIGIGGSATNDGGAGMLSALGFELTDKNGKPICSGTKGLENLNSVSANNRNSRTFRVYIPHCLRRNKSVMRKKRLQRRFCSSKGRRRRNNTNHGQMALEICKYCKDLIGQGADPDLAGAGSRRRLGFCVCSIYKRVFGTGNTNYF